nr:MAG TPA: hypothetical protein [Caudoviricetes sp.]
MRESVIYWSVLFWKEGFLCTSAITSCGSY